MARLIAVGDYIVAENMTEKERQTAGGIIIPTTAKQYFKFKILAVGPKVKRVLGHELKPGDIVLCYKDLGIEWEGKFIAPASQIIAIL